MMKFKKCEAYIRMSKGVQKTNGYLEEYPEIKNYLNKLKESENNETDK